ncbi:MAG: hypothetical protein K2J60_07930 [Acetatifactor sp.]|nr:hypothetical protein [Acetatifactor sp.]
MLKKSLWAIGVGFKDKNISAGFSRALENIRNNLTQFQKFSIGALGVAGEFALVKNGFKEIEIGSDNLVASLGKIAGGAGIAVAALKLIGHSNPFTAVIVGATGLAGAIMGINEARKEAFENLAESKELEAFGEKLSNITTRLNESAQATKDRMAASMEYVQNAGVGEMQMAKDLADRYFDLYEKENLTNEETEEMQRLAQLLIEKAPELNQYYDEQTGLINGTRDAINDVIDARLREIQLNAISEE